MGALLFSTQDFLLFPRIFDISWNFFFVSLFFLFFEKMSWLNCQGADSSAEPSLIPGNQLDWLLHEGSQTGPSPMPAGSASSAPILTGNISSSLCASSTDVPCEESKPCSSTPRSCELLTSQLAMEQARRTAHTALNLSLATRTLRSTRSSLESMRTALNEMDRVLERTCTSLQTEYETVPLREKSPRITPQSLSNSTAASLRSSKPFGAMSEPGTPEQHMHRQLLVGSMDARAQGSLGKPTLMRQPTLYQECILNPPTASGLIPTMDTTP